VDTYDLSNYAGGVSINLNPGEWTITSTSQLAKLKSDGTQLARGNVANAFLFNGDVRSIIENATSGAGNDTLIGNQVANVLIGNDGDDTLTGVGGDDTLYGGNGSDTAVYSGLRSQYAVVTLSNGSLQITDTRSGANDGVDIVWTMEFFKFADNVYSAVDLVSGVTSPTPVVTNQTLTGTSGVDTLIGAAGADTLIGLAGADRLDGGEGMDTASYATATAGLTVNMLTPSKSTRDAYGDIFISIENLIGSNYNDTLCGDNLANVISGRGGSDYLYGNGGADTLYGGAGKDVLYGGAGADQLFGGDGLDTFVFTTLSDSTTAAHDVINDFMRGDDKIDLRSIDAQTNKGGDQAFSFIGANAFTGVAGQLNFINDVVYGDVNGDRVADFAIQVLNNVILGSLDFYV